MIKKYIISVFIPILFLQFSACYSRIEITKAELINSDNSRALFIVTKDTTTYSFDDNDYHISNDTITGKGIITDKNNELNEIQFNGKIALSNISKLQSEEFDTFNTVMLTTGIILTAALLVFGIIYLNFKDK